MNPYTLLLTTSCQMHRWYWYTFAFVLSRRCVREQGAFDMKSSAKALGHIIMAANCIAPDLCKNVAPVPTLAVDFIFFT